MGRFVPKTYLEWREPEAYRREMSKKNLSRREKILLALLLVTFFLFFWLRDILDPPKNPRPFWFYLLPPATMFVGFGCASLLGTSPYTVKIREDGVKIEGGGGAHLWKYKSILDYNIESQNINGKVFTVLSIIPVRGRKQSFGIDPGISLDELERIISEKWGQQRDPKIILRGKEFRS